MKIYSVDIGGSSIKHGIVSVDRNKAEITERMPSIDLSTRSFSEIRNRVVSAVAAHAQKVGHRVDVGISTTGGVAKSGLVWNAGHFTDYKNIDWQKILKSELPSSIGRVVTINDGKASTWAEYQRVSVGTEVFVHFVVGSGIGGGIVFRDQLLYGDEETAGALGHMKVGGESDVLCSCGHKNCVETLASSQAIARLYGASIRDCERGRSVPPTFEETFKAFELAGEWLGVAISNVINVLNPHCITVGGGVILASAKLANKDGGPYLESAIHRARELAFKDVAEETIIKAASAGNDGGLLGAALLCASAVSSKK